MSFIRNIAALAAGMAVCCHLQAQPSVLGSGYWYKFSVAADGVYKIDYSALRKAGFDVDHLDPRRLRLYTGGNGMLPQANDAARINHPKEVAVVVQGESDGKMDKQDYLLFYAQGPDQHHYDPARKTFYYENNLYADRNYYFLTISDQAGQRMPTRLDLGKGYPVVNTFDDFGYYETEKYNLLKSGRQWFGEQFSESNDLTVRFDLPGIIGNSNIKLVSSVMAQAYASSSSFKLFYNDQPIAEQVLDAIPNLQYSLKGATRLDTMTFGATSVNASNQVPQNIHYQYVRATSGTSIGYLDYFLFSFQRSLAFSGTQTQFTSGRSLDQSVSQFEVNSLPTNAIIWNVTDPFHSEVQAYDLSSGKGVFSVTTDTLKSFVAFAPDKLPAPLPEALMVNQDLNSLSSPDLLIVTYPTFKTEALRLAAHRQAHDQLTVAVVTTSEIYNEYSGGKQDITAIRDFVRELYHRPGSGLNNLLLLGRCSYDYKGRVLNNTNFVPTYESRNSLWPLETFSSDDYFGFLESNEGEWLESPAQDHTMEIGVGRFSVTTLKQATDVVNKLIDYDVNPKGFGDWRQDILFVADDGDASLHESQADQLASFIDNNHPDFITHKLYLDAYRQVMTNAGQASPDATDALYKAVEEGTGIVNYTGHGSEELWMQERLLDNGLVKKWKNGPRYPLFVTATCEFGRHDDPFQISNGEKLFLQPLGGAIGLVTTARPVNSATNFQLNKEFYLALFNKPSGQFRDLGSIFRDTKNNSLSGTANRNFSLLGDPSMQLALAQNDVVITEAKTSNLSDTIKALSVVTIKGEIRQNGSIRNGFQGVADLVVFDKLVQRSTLADTVDHNLVFSFSEWSNRLFRGKATVKNGLFETSFVASKDLAALVGQGKICVYAQNGTENASGSKVVKLGGMESNALPDDLPPDGIELYIGDTTFVDGGIASADTRLIVKVHDDHGISITALGGRDNLTATLDDSVNYVLNVFYESDLDDFTHGRVSFPLTGLHKGGHVIRVEISDVYGNRTFALVHFVVSDKGIHISNFHNFPNPFASLTQTTILGFTHNRPGEGLDAELTIYDMAGQLVNAKQYTINESYSRVLLEEWNGSDAGGNKLRAGLYVCKLSVRSLLDGSKNEQFTKLIIVN